MSEKKCELILEKVRAIITDVVEVDPNAIQMHANLRDDLRADSLANVEIVMALEDVFGIVINEERAAKLYTVGDLVLAISETTEDTSVGSA